MVWVVDGMDGCRIFSCTLAMLQDGICLCVSLCRSLQKKNWKTADIDLDVESFVSIFGLRNFDLTVDAPRVRYWLSTKQTLSEWNLSLRCAVSMVNPWLMQQAPGALNDENAQVLCFLGHIIIKLDCSAVLWEIALSKKTVQWCYCQKCV